jgi:hypothetical protein
MTEDRVLHHLLDERPFKRNCSDVCRYQSTQNYSLTIKQTTQLYAGGEQSGENY